ncbi:MULTISPECIES: hypothetical protein [Sphingobacterium]|uniref:hypothetical protein n=1 Tax=Sphingobacterium TaxID=28453 RepID=UPI002579EEF3|nr:MULTISPECIES: hypothetical protein [Sphingobacterium]
MPKVINQTSVSIDSLQEKITLLESNFKKLTAEHKVVLDSLKSFDKTLQKSEIATTFYDTHLSTYTSNFWGIITIVLFIIGIVSWKAFLVPYNKKLEDLKVELKEDVKKRSDEMEEAFKRQRSTLFDAASWSFRAMSMILDFQNKHGISLLFKLREINLMALEAPYDANASKIEKLCESCLQFIIAYKLTFTDLPNRSEFDQMESNVIGKGKERIIEYWYKFKNELAKIHPPQTSYDVDTDTSSED